MEEILIFIAYIYMLSGCNHIENEAAMQVSKLIINYTFNFITEFYITAISFVQAESLFKAVL